MAEFLDPLIAQDIDDINFQLYRTFRYQSEVLGETIIIPAGFVTDFCSTWSHKYARQAGAVHDWLYASAMVDRSTSDLVLKEAIQSYPTLFVRSLAWPYYLAVRAYGWKPWDAHRDSKDELTCNALLRAVQGPTYV